MSQACRLLIVAGIGFHIPLAFAGCDLPMFAGARLFAAGSSPTYLATGDFNGDGKIDVVVTTQSTNTVSVMLSNGDGTFQPAANYTLPSPKNIIAADLNGDGKLDQAISSSFNTVVMLGNGDGTFETGVNYPTGTKATWVAIGDLNGDGRPDLAVADYGTGNLAVLLGVGDGTFQTAVKYAVLPGMNSVVMGDFNGDGNLDLAASTGPANPSAVANGFATVLLGNGDGTFRNALTYGAGADATSLAVGDLNGDGKPDLVFADDLSNSLVVLLNSHVAGSGGSACSPVAPLSQ